MKQIFKLDSQVLLHQKSKKVLSAEYGVHPRTISRMCKALAFETSKRLLSVRQVCSFYEHYGMPGRYTLSQTMTIE